MVLIKDFLEEGEDLELLWIAGLQHDPECGWQVRPVTRGIATGNIRLWHLPIALWPFFAPGRCFTDGCLARTAVRGEIGWVTIPDVAAGSEVTSDHIPQELYSFEGRRAGVQRLLRYEVENIQYFVPTAELIRYLFMHNKTLANTLMHPGGLLELFAPELPGHHPNLHLRFTDRMPRSCLSSAFAEEFAWLAVHPEGRRSWDSVHEHSEGHKYISFQPPAIHSSNWVYRGLTHKGTVLVLEITHISGRNQPCDHLAYSHPSLRASTSRSQQHRTGTVHEPPQGNVDEAEPIARNYIVETSSPGSRSSVRQAALHTLGKSGSFDREIPITKIVTNVCRAGTSIRTSRPSRKANPTQVPVRASVAETLLAADLPPIEFRILEPAGPDYVGELKPLMMVIKAIAASLPSVTVSMSLCRLKPGRAFSMAGRHRRVCLIATFTPVNSSPIVLVDIDHSGERALSGIALLYQKPCTFYDIEHHVAALLDELVAKGGHWNLSIAQAFSHTCACKRLPRVLRRRQRLEDHEYLTTWASKLAVRLGLVKAQ